MLPGEFVASAVWGEIFQEGFKPSCSFSLLSFFSNASEGFYVTQKNPEQQFLFLPQVGVRQKGASPFSGRILCAITTVSVHLDWLLWERGVQASFFILGSPGYPFYCVSGSRLAHHPLPMLGEFP